MNEKIAPTIQREVSAGVEVHARVFPANINYLCNLISTLRV